MRCEYCCKEKPLTCNNSRDAEEMAIEGDIDCLEQLALRNMGEKGLRHVVLNYVDKLRTAATIRALKSELPK
jgi:hypothetical protein